MAILDRRPEWAELRDVIDRHHPRRYHLGTGTDCRWQKECSCRRTASSQPNLRRTFLPSPQWIHQSRLFEGTDPLTKNDLAKWTMDFVKRGDAALDSPESDFGLGVEVTFNHAEATAWTLVRLDLASEAGANIREQARIDVGVAIYASRSFKRWGRMDSAVGTFEQASLWLGQMKPVLPIPLVLVGLNPQDSGSTAIWDDPGVFRGTRKG